MLKFKLGCYTSNDSGVPSKLDSTLTPKLLTYSRKYN